MTAPKATSSLYDVVAAWQGELPWGRVLDAGSGAASLSWILRQETTAWTAVTADTGMYATMQQVSQGQMRADDALVLGNWMDDKLLQGARFDTVLVDYLVGAIEGFAPYWQNYVFSRLKPLATQRLYVIGLEPYVPYWPEESNAAGRLVCEIGRLRDSCLLLSGARPYREYPGQWVLQQLVQNGFELLEARHFPVRYGERFVNNQLNMCERHIARLSNETLANALRDHAQQLRQRALTFIEEHGALAHGSDYVIAAQVMASPQPLSR